MGQTLQEVVDTAGGGSAVTLFEALLGNRRLSKRETERIRTMISQAKRKKATKRK